jgi:hypothetical protein
MDWLASSRLSGTRTRTAVQGRLEIEIHGEESNEDPRPAEHASTRHAHHGLTGLKVYFVLHYTLDSDTGLGSCFEEATRSTKLERGDFRHPRLKLSPARCSFEIKVSPPPDL